MFNFVGFVEKKLIGRYCKAVVIRTNFKKVAQEA